MFIVFLSVLYYQTISFTDEEQLVTFNLKELPKITDTRLSEIGFSGIEYISLQTNEKSLIKGITDIKVGNGYFLIQYYNTIMKFNSNGTFVTKIGREGRGPHEFSVVHYIDIDKNNHKIYLVSAWQRKFFVYSENGKFIRTIPAPLNTSHFKITTEGILCYSINSFANVKTSFNLIDTTGLLLKSYPNKYRWNLKFKNAFVFPQENIFYKYNDQLFTKEVYSDTIFLFENMLFKPHLVIDEGKRSITPKSRSDFSGMQIMERYVIPMNLFEFGDYLYYEFLYNHEYLGFVGSKKSDYQVLINMEQGIINDLDGGANLRPVAIVDDNTIISWVNALQLKTHVASEEFKNSKPKYPEKKKELEKLAASLKETDNPVLVLVRLKE